MSNIQIDFPNKYFDSNCVPVIGAIEDDDDDDEDDNTTLTEDLWSSTPTTSSQFSGSQEEGRSSTSSIPWAEDAIKQNEDEWKSIEEMFYGERPLPENKIIRDEILEWTKRFPHIRVTGQKIIINSTTVNDIEKCQQNNLEEIIAIDPSPILKKLPQPLATTQPLTPHTPTIQHRRAQTFINGSSQNVLFNNRNPSFQRTEYLHNNALGLAATTTTTRSMMRIPVGGAGGGGGGGNMDLQNQIEKCLRITSGPLLSRRKSLMPPQNSAKSEMTNKFTINKLLTPTINEEYFSRRPRITSVRSDAFFINGAIETNRRYGYQQQQQQDQQLSQHSLRHIHNHNNNNNQRTLLSPIKLPLVMSAKLLTIPPSLMDDNNSDVGKFIGRFNSNESITKSDNNLRKKPKLQSRFTLPALDFRPKFDGELIGRSISAINQIPTSRY